MPDWGALDVSYSTLTFQAASSIQYGTLTWSGNQDTKGSWSVLGTTTIPYHGFFVLIASISTATTSLTDIAVGSPPSVVLSDIMLGTPRVSMNSCYVYVPTAVASNTALWARTQAFATNSVVHVQIYGSTGGFPGMPRFSFARTYGTMTNSNWILSDSGATSNTKGPWVVIGTPSYHVKGGQLLVSAGTVNASLDSFYAVDIGIGSPVQIIFGDLLFKSDGTSDLFTPSSLSLLCNIASGTAISVRHKCQLTNATARLMRFQFIGYH